MTTEHEIETLKAFIKGTELNTIRVYLGDRVVGTHNITNDWRLSMIINFVTQEHGYDNWDNFEILKT